MRKVILIGSGPSAAYAILACRSLGIEPKIISNNPPNSFQFGAFFLHFLPEEFVKQTGAQVVDVDWIPLGTREGYLRKQGYNDLALPCSFPEERRTVKMYSSAWLDKVWEQTEWELGEVTAWDTGMLGARVDFVFYTFPLVKNGRKLEHFAVADAKIPLEGASITYNGEEEGDWVRKTIAFGRISYEYPGDINMGMLPKDQHGVICFQKHLLREITPDTKPLAKSEYLAPNIIPIGRYAEWERKRLSHEVYARVLEVLNG